MTNFEKDLQELEKTVERLTSGENTLDEALEKYKAGLELSKKCYQKLQRVEKEVKIFSENGDEVFE